MAAGGGAVALLLTAGTALALASGADDALAGAVRPAESTSESTSTSTPTASTSTLAPTVPAGPEVITQQQAAQIAVAYAGGGTVIEIERELEDGRVEWKVRVVNAGQRFDVRVDTTTGAITRVDTDARGDDNARNDDRGHRQAEPGDDHGRTREPEPGDDRGGNSGHGGSGSGNSGPGGGSGGGHGGHGSDDPPGDDRGGDR